METEILKMVKSYLGDDYPEEQEGAIVILVGTNIDEFKSNMSYPDNYTEERIQQDLLKYKSCIFWCVIYDLVMMGVEFEQSHSENGINHSWKSKGDIYAQYAVVPYADI